MQPFKSVAYAAVAPGTRLIVLGAVHGNETCGTKGIARVIAEIDAGSLVLSAGRVTFVPVTNPLAYANKRRTGDRNLNRKLTPTEAPREFEDHVANWLCPLLAGHEVLLDLHSFTAPGVPFLFMGPVNNAGTIQPFDRAAREQALAQRLGVGRAVDGWLTTYAAGVARRRRTRQVSRSDARPRPALRHRHHRVHARSIGGSALTLECGQHEDPAAPDVAYRAIVNTLAHLRLIDAPDPAPSRMECLSL
jgi:predicted deacylase